MKSVKSLKNLVFPSAILVVVYLTLALPAKAQVVFTDNEGAFIAAYPNQLVQTFAAGDVSPGLSTICGPIINNTTDDDCFDPGDILPGIEFMVNPGILFLAGVNLVGVGNPRNALSTDEGSTMDIFFANAENVVGIRPGCFVEGPVCSETLVIRVFDVNDVLIGSTNVDVTSSFDDFLGIESSIAIARINLSGSATQAVDEVRFGGFSENIPTLSEWGMISAAAGLGLVGVFFAVRKRLRASEQPDARG